MSSPTPVCPSFSPDQAGARPGQEVHYYNRYTARIEKEVIYGEGFLRWVYGNPLGNLSLHALVKRTLFSRWYGWRMDRPSSRARVLPFIQQYGVDPSEFADPPESYSTFNAFFYRKLKKEARPVDADPRSVVFPADGRHLGFQDLGSVDRIYAKGQTLSLAELLQDSQLASRFARGSMVISRLCPVDYHRFHFPVGGAPSPTRILDGHFASVNPIALRQHIRILVENKRWLTGIETEGLGLVLMLEVGATCVGSVAYTFTPGSTVRKGDEKGYFQFGGSMTICLFEPGRVRLAQDLLECTRHGMELYAHVGDRVGEVL